MIVLWRPLAAYGRPEWRGLIGLLALAVAGVALEALLPWPLKLIIDQVLGGAPMPASLTWIAALPGGREPSGRLLWLSLSMLLFFLAVRAVSLLKSVLHASVSGRMKYALAADVFDRLQTLSLRWHRQAHTGDLLRRVVDDTDCLPLALTGVVLPAVVSLVSLGVFFAIMWQLNALLATLSALVAIPMMVFIRVLGPRMTEREYQRQQREGEVWSLAEQTLTSLPLVQAFSREEHEGNRFRSVTQRSMRAYVHTLVTQLQFKAGVDSSQAVGAALVMFIGGLYASIGTVSVGGLIVFLAYLAALYAPMNSLAYSSSTFAAAVAKACRVREILDADDRVEDRVPALRSDSSKTRCTGRVRIENAVFGYRPGEMVLRGVTLDLAAGETVALVGATGAGKSTLASLIPRLFDPWEGRVLMDDCDIRGLPLADIRSQVAVVLQDPWLLPVSIADNIAYGRPEATRAEVVAAAIAACADNFISKLPAGYDTVVGERGVTLSGGERQRLSIARALLKNAPILILDEPTSALDVETEYLLQQALRELMKDRTTLIIAHRLSTIRMADRVVVLDEGRLTGTSVAGAVAQSTAG